MLEELHVSNIALIEDATLGFAPGLTVLTGETGAGKTALLAALKLICGARADATVVRDGSDEALAEALLADEDEHVVRRRLSAAGKSRCTIDGAMATVKELAAMTSSIEVHGQHEQVALLEPVRQLAYLDDSAEDGEALERYRSARAAYFEAKDELEELMRMQGESDQQLEYLSFVREQIEKVDPQPGEYEQLEEELPRLQNADQLAQSLQAARDALHADGGAIDLLAKAFGELSRQRGIDDELDELSERLYVALQELEDLARDISGYAETIDTDPYRLEETLGRLDELSGLMKRFGPDMNSVFETWEKAKLAQDAAGDSPQRMHDAQAAVEAAHLAYERAASELSQRRHQASRTFCEELAKSVHELAMEGASFDFEFDELPFERWTESGSEQVELMYQPAKAAKMRPLRRIASGGELSRILLALECLHYGSGAHDVERSTIVFDEVDSGIGGATGNAVARRLASLSKDVQVIVVTHLAQVAALADTHYVVMKDIQPAGLPQTSVVVVSGEDRVVEVARMLSGDDDVQALNHARALLEGARS